MSTTSDTDPSRVETREHFTLSAGTVLGSDGCLNRMDLHLGGGLVTTSPGAQSAKLDVSGCLVLPGIIDTHGDGFEHHLLPRVTSKFPAWVALRNVDRELLANGITTAFLAQSYSWEGGIRGVDSARALIEGLRDLDPAPACDMRVQIRYETFFLDGAEQLVEWLEDGTVRYVVFNDHVPQYQAHLDDDERIARWAAPLGLSTCEFRALLQETFDKGMGVLASIANVSETMTRLGVPFGSHDDPDPETRRRYNDLGARIAEFPLSIAAAETARELGNPIMMGAPNALRGVSASGNVSARELITLGLCDALVSDYYYPALLHAPFALASEGVADLPTAWGLVSSGPAMALGLADRGSLAPGKRGDLVVIRQGADGRPHVMATFVEGRPVFLDPALTASALAS
ncbi:MAG: alpha-D-ribose 1-methylphosphonate 5-triphosphate diphosphatase [Pseudomonadota bacterium]